jgi:cellulose synthase/poly-beta-1,6-N-acetylglucosamine synthase-like glycosyltransferase
MLDDLLLGGFTLLNSAWLALNGYNILPILSWKRDKTETDPEEKTKNKMSISILLPAYKESEVLEDTVSKIEESNYPKSKLELLLLTEKDDKDTSIIASRLSKKYKNVHVFRVKNDDVPKGKPRALTQALSRAKGDIIGVLDAEDIINKNLFTYVNNEIKNNNYDAVQGKLRLNYNKSSWMNMQSRAEYETWYQTTLPAFANNGYPVPLGGTTNFFKKAIIKDMGWNAYSLAEDFELGLRLYNSKHKIKLMDVVTDEQTTPNLKSWIRQRTRWDRGKLEASENLHKYDMNFKHKFMSYMMCASPYIGVVNVFGAATSLAIYGLHISMPFYELVTTYVNSAFIGAYAYLHGRGYFRASDKTLRSVLSSIMVGATLPAYWVLQWGAAIRAVKRELFEKDQIWEKTPHYKLKK